MEGKLKIASYNCQVIKTSEPHIKDILGQMHIMAFQEMWLCGDELDRLNSIYSDFVSISTSAVDGSQCMYTETNHMGSHISLEQEPE